MLTIPKWSELFENADTRKRQRLGWYLAPSGCDSAGYRALMRDQPDGLLALGVFSALCQLMATRSKDTRKTGTFAHSDGRPMTLDDLLELTRLDRDCFEIAIPILVEIGWISLISAATRHDTGTTPAEAQHNSPQLPQLQDVSENLPPSCHLHPAFVKGEGEGEGEGEGGALADSPPPPPKLRSVTPDALAGLQQHLRDTFPHDASTLSPKDLAGIQKWRQWLTAEMTAEHWQALGQWMRASEALRGRSLFPRDRAEFLRAPPLALPVFWKWWTTGARARLNRRAPASTSDLDPSDPPLDRETALRILKA